MGEFYNEKHVGTKARSDKVCRWCGKKIKKGTPHYMLIDMELYSQFPIHESCKEDAGEKCNWDVKELEKYLEQNDFYLTGIAAKGK